MTLLLRPSIQLNKSLTVLKTTFYENVPDYVLISKSDILFSTFFSDQLDQQLALQKNLLELSHSYVDTQSNWTCPWLYRKPLFMKMHQIFFELEIWQPIKYIFLRPAGSTIRSPWEPTRTMKLLRRPSIQLNKFLTVLKTTFYENAIRIIFELEIWHFKYFFLRPARSTISSPWEPTRTMTRLCGLSIQLNKPLTLLKTTFHEKAPE